MIHKVLTKTHLSLEISSKSVIITWMTMHRFSSDSEFPLDIFVYKMVNSRISVLNKLSIPDGQNVRFACISSVIFRYVAEMVKRPLRGQQTQSDSGFNSLIEYPWWLAIMVFHHSWVNNQQSNLKGEGVTLAKNGDGYAWPHLPLFSNSLSWALFFCLFVCFVLFLFGFAPTPISSPRKDPFNCH